MGYHNLLHIIKPKAYGFGDSQPYNNWLPATSTEAPRLDHIDHVNMCYIEHVFHCPCYHWGRDRMHSCCRSRTVDGLDVGCGYIENLGTINSYDLCDRCKQRMAQGGSWRPFSPMSAEAWAKIEEKNQQRLCDTCKYHMAHGGGWRPPCAPVSAEACKVEEKDQQQSNEKNTQAACKVEEKNQQQSKEKNTQTACEEEDKNQQQSKEKNTQARSGNCFPSKDKDYNTDQTWIDRIRYWYWMRWLPTRFRRGDP
jgi:hypothetical protein